MSSLTDPFALVGTQLEGKYDIESVVAEGGFGVIYRAAHRALQKPVAVKVLKTPPTVPESARHEFIEKFVFEARTIARLEHPGIVRVLDFGGGLLPSGEAAPWLVLEWIDGQTLEDDLASRRAQGGSSPVEALTLLRPIFEALAVAHDEGVAHRDLKPANVMLARTRRGIEPKLLDFGIAKAMGADESASAHQTSTQSELRAFTLAYAAPEQLGGTRTGPWTDVHALALLLVEALTNRAPLTGEDTTALCGEVLSPLRPTPAKFGLDVGAWEPVLARALALRAGERFQHAGEFLRALDASMPAAATWTATQAPLAQPTYPEAKAVTTLRPANRAAPTPSSRGLWLALAIVSGVVALSAIAGLVRMQSPSTPSAPARSMARPAPPPAPPPATLLAPTPIEPQVARVPVVAVTDVGVTIGAVTTPAPRRQPPAPRPRVLPSSTQPARPTAHEHVPIE